jgi:tRNA uridine 5-carbamoylmethylation protein Kti12
MKLYLSAQFPIDYNGVIDFKITYTGDPFDTTLFHCNSNYQIFKSIDQLQPVEQEIVSLCIKLYETERSELSWEGDILPILRNHKISKLIDKVLK